MPLTKLLKGWARPTTTGLPATSLTGPIVGRPAFCQWSRDKRILVNDARRRPRRPYREAKRVPGPLPNSNVT